MKHETRRYRGAAAFSYARRNRGAFLKLERQLADAKGLGWLYELPEDAERIAALIATYGEDAFWIDGGVSDEHDEAFFLWLLHTYAPPGASSQEKALGLDLTQLALEAHTSVGSVTLECIGLRLAQEGKVVVNLAVDGFTFRLPAAPEGALGRCAWGAQRGG